MGFATLLVVLFGYLTYWFSPHQRIYQESKQKLTTAQNELQQRSSLVGELTQRLAASVQENSTGKKEKDILPTGRRLGEVLQQIVGQDSALVTNAIQLVKTDKQKEFRDVLLNLEIEGSFKSIGSFVERLEGSKVLSEVSKIDVSRASPDLEKCIAKVSLKVRLLGVEDAD